MTLSQKQIPFSLLDLVTITQEGSVKEAIENSCELAQFAEEKKYKRFWLAEHHAMPGIASAATSLVMSYVASATKEIRIGSGGIMLPNHSPLVIAEQFGTLAAMHPGRIDLGLGRAPGTDQKTMLALRRDPRKVGDDFPLLLEELQNYFEDNHEGVIAVPGRGENIPIWILGSSDFGARLAGQLGLPFGFASHFSPQNTEVALHVYRTSFRPSVYLKEPYAMVCISAFAADTSEQAHYVSSSTHLQFLSIIRGKPQRLQKPVDDIDEYWSPQEKFAVKHQLASTIIGNKEEVHAGIDQLIEKTQINELMIYSNAYYLEDRLKTYDIIAQHPLFLK